MNAKIDDVRKMDENAAGHGQFKKVYVWTVQLIKTNILLSEKDESQVFTTSSPSLGKIWAHKQPHKNGLTHWILNLGDVDEMLARRVGVGWM